MPHSLLVLIEVCDRLGQLLFNHLYLLLAFNDELLNEIVNLRPALFHPGDCRCGCFDVAIHLINFLLICIQLNMEHLIVRLILQLELDQRLEIHLLPHGQFDRRQLAFCLGDGLFDLL